MAQSQAWPIHHLQRRCQRFAVGERADLQVGMAEGNAVERFRIDWTDYAADSAQYISCMPRLEKTAALRAQPAPPIVLGS